MACLVIALLLVQYFRCKRPLRSCDIIKKKNKKRIVAQSDKKTTPAPSIHPSIQKKYSADCFRIVWLVSWLSKVLVEFGVTTTVKDDGRIGGASNQSVFHPRRRNNNNNNLQPPGGLCCWRQQWWWSLEDSRNARNDPQLQRENQRGPDDGRCWNGGR